MAFAFCFILCISWEVCSIRSPMSVTCSDAFSEISACIVALSAILFTAEPTSFMELVVSLAVCSRSPDAVNTAFALSAIFTILCAISPCSSLIARDKSPISSFLCKSCPSILVRKSPFATDCTRPMLFFREPVMEAVNKTASTIQPIITKTITPTTI